MPCLTSVVQATVGAILESFFMPETRDMTLERIEKIIAGAKKHHGTAEIGYAEDYDGADEILKRNKETHQHMDGQ